MTHLFAQNHVGTEISPILSLCLLIFPINFWRGNDSVSQPHVCDSDHQMDGGGWSGEGKRLISLWHFSFPFSGLLLAVFLRTDPGLSTTKRGKPSCCHGLTTADTQWLPTKQLWCPLQSIVSLILQPLCEVLFPYKDEKGAQRDGMTCPCSSNKFRLWIWVWLYSFQQLCTSTLFTDKTSVGRHTTGVLES